MKTIRIIRRFNSENNTECNTLLGSLKVTGTRLKSLLFLLGDEDQPLNLVLREAEIAQLREQNPEDPAHNAAFYDADLISIEEVF